MAKKKTKKGNPSKKKKSKKNDLVKLQFIKIAIGLLILVLLVVLAGLLARHFLFKKRPMASLADRQIHAPTDTSKLTFEIYPKTDTPSSKQAKKPEVPFEGTLPKIAIIIDDTGYDTEIIKKFISLNAPLTLSILPQSPFKNRIATLALKEGYELMLHLPMEPYEYPKVNPGPGTLLTTMPPDELIRVLKQDLDEIPHIKGVNNHMGSKMTANAEQMRQIFTVLKQRGLFFVDSRTTANTICKLSAQLLHVPFGERDVFIDHKHHREFIEKQMQELARISRTHGEAIGIAHPHQSTYRVLEKMIPEMKKSINFVPVSTLVRPVS